MMSTLKAEALAREFQYNGIRIPDPGPEWPAPIFRIQIILSQPQP